MQKSTQKRYLDYHDLRLFRPFMMVLLVAVAFLMVFPVMARATQQETGPIYIVQPGDTLNEIALRFGLLPEDIQTANSIDNPNSLFVGQNLRIPGLEGISGVLTSEILPLGMTLNNLARKNHINPQDLVTLNRLISPSEMIAGVSVIVPIDDTQEEFVMVPTAANGSSPLETAIRAGVSPWVLVNDNRLYSTWDILPGEALFTNQISDLVSNTLNNTIDLTINQLPVVQGETLHLTIVTEMPVEISGNFNGENLQFFTENENEYHSFLGIHALAEPGVYPLFIFIESDHGSHVVVEQQVLLASGFYPNEWVRIDDIIYLDEDKIAEEDAYLEPYRLQITPTRYWDGRFQFPVDEPCPSSFFGSRRDYNNGLLFYFHSGVDFRVCAQNLNIYAVAPGRVILAKEMFTLGNAVYIDHGWGVISGYAHLREFTVEEGDFVQAGDLIGIIGNTGRSAGPHLHFEILISGIHVNPLTWLNQTFP